MMGAERSAKRAIIRLARHLGSRGLSPGSSGNLSVRIGDRVIVTPTGSSFARVRARDLATVSMDGVRSGRAVPSKEAPLHLAAYRADAALRAVVHLHSPACVAIACLPALPDGRADLPDYTPYRVMQLGSVPLLPFAAPGSTALGGGVGRAVSDGSRVMLLANHGSVVVADSLSRAADLAEELETSAQLTLVLSTRPGVELSSEQWMPLAPPKG